MFQTLAGGDQEAIIILRVGFIKLFFVVVVICHSLKGVPIGIPIIINKP
jgi:hypothetical protein